MGKKAKPPERQGQRHNGGLVDGEFEKVSSSTLILNGAQVVGPNEFNQNVILIEKPVMLTSANTLSVEVRGKPGGGITVLVIGVDNDLPTITASVNPSPNLVGWHNQDVTVTFDCADATSGIATCPNPVTLTTEGANQLITGTAIDLAGNTVSASVSLNIDKTPPVIFLTSPTASFATNQTALTVSGTVTDQQAITGVTVNGVPASLAGNFFETDLTLTEGTNLITVTAADIADNTASSTRTVTLDSTPPQVAITAPANLSTFNTSVLTLTGTVDDPAAGVPVDFAVVAGGGKVDNNPAAERPEPETGFYASTCRSGF